MSREVGAELRRLVVSRPRRVCEYGLIHEDDTFFGCEVDHIIGRKHGGPTEAANLAFACFPCNRRKGSDVGSVVPLTGEVVRLYHPRTDRWFDHFAFDGVVIRPLTLVGDVTARLLGLNDGDRILERQALRIVGRYPSPDATLLAGGGAS